MVRGNFANHDYFIDCNGAGRSVARAVFGAWVTIWIAVVTACLRSMYRSRLKHRVFGQRPDKPIVSLWNISPASSAHEVFESRNILLQSATRWNIMYVLASLGCIVAGVVSAMSTTIANHAIDSHVVMRTASVRGINVTNEHSTLLGAVVQVTSRVQALEKANAPLTELFDFVPDDSSGWVYVAEEWNNSWKGQCSYHLHPAVDLHVYTTNSSAYQDELPGLGALLPRWATEDPRRQAVDYAGFYTNVNVNGSGVYVDLVLTYAFGSEPDGGGANDASSVNISFANVLLHHVGRTRDRNIEDTLLRSDVHVVECTFNNSAPGFAGQSYAQGGNYANAAQNVASLYQRFVIEASVNNRPFVQPTGQQMLRYWQAFMSVKDSQYPLHQERLLSVSRPVVQLRLSALVTTGGLFLLVIVGTIALRYAEPRGQLKELIDIPSTQLDWIVLAASEHRLRAGERGSTGPSSKFAKEHGELGLVIELAPDGLTTARIVSSDICEEASSGTNWEKGVLLDRVH